MTPPKKDKLFARRGPVKPFAFTRAVAEVFDDMVARSVPQYAGVQEQILEICQSLTKKPKRIFDLGCSTGSLILYLAQQLDAAGSTYIGVDKSAEMIAKANEKLLARKVKGQIRFVCEDILTVDLRGADVVVLNYVLQFLPPTKRLPFLKGMRRRLKPGAVLIVSEKTQSASMPLRKTFIAAHEAFKRKNKYSALEIARKRKALETVLVPFSLEDNLKLLRKAGFQAVEPFFVWYNFASIVAVA